MTVQEKINQYLENRYDVYIFDETGKDDEVVYDDRCIHITRNGVRYAFDIPEYESETDRNIERLTGIYQRRVDKAHRHAKFGARPKTDPMLTYGEFNQLKGCAIRVWADYDNTHGYVDEKVSRVLAFPRSEISVAGIVGMFDGSNQAKLFNHLGEKLTAKIKNLYGKV